MRDTLVFSNSVSGYVADGVVEHLQALGEPVRRGKMIVEPYSDGESGLYIDESVLDELHVNDCIVIGACPHAEAHLELRDTIIDLKKHYARRIHAAVLYLKDPTQEKEKERGEAQKALNRMREILTSGQDLTSFFDLHNDLVREAQSGEHLTDHLYSKELVIAEILELAKQGKKITLMAPDQGRADWVTSLAIDAGKRANELGISLDIVVDNMIKKRIRGKTETITKPEDIRPSCEGRLVMIFDDMIRSGSTILPPIDLCYAAGAEEVQLMSTHAVLSNGKNGVNAEELLQASRASRIIVSNSHPRSQRIDLQKNDKFKVVDIAGIVAERIRKFGRIARDRAA